MALRKVSLGLKVDLNISDQRSNKGLFLSAEEVLDILEKFNYHMKKPSVNNSISFKLAFFMKHIYAKGYDIMSSHLRVYGAFFLSPSCELGLVHFTLPYWEKGGGGG